MSHKSSRESSQGTLDTILEKWSSAKEKISKMEEKIEKYKKYVSKSMDSKGVNELASENYTVSKRKNTRNYLSKDSVPKDVWEKYKITSNYESFFIKKK